MKNKLDFTTPAQKLMAAGLVVLTGVILFYVTPPLVELFKNLWLLALYTLPILFAVLNYQTIWVIYKNLVWKATQKIISTDKIAYMYQYHTHLVDKVTKLEINTTSIVQAKVQLERKLGEILATINDNTTKAAMLQNIPGSEISLKTLHNKINVDTKIAESLGPKLESVRAQSEYLQELTKHWEADAEQLKYTLDAKSEEYQLLKSTSEATGNAAEFLKGDTIEYKMFEESLKQIEADVALYTANVETFERKVAPILEGKKTDTLLSEEQGRLLVEEFISNTKQIKF